MEKMDEKFEQLLKGSLNVFMKYGIRSVTMDDLARHLAVSKKTLYKYVKDKNDLVLKGLEYHHHLEQCTLESCMNQELNAIDEMFEVSKVILDQLSNIHPSVMYDLEKYYPEALASMNQYKMTVVKGWVEDNLKRGIEEGYYRDDLVIPIITAIYLARMDDFFDRELYPENQFSFKEIYIEMFRYHIRGIASAKGIEYLKEKMKELNK